MLHLQYGGAAGPLAAAPVPTSTLAAFSFPSSTSSNMAGSHAYAFLNGANQVNCHFELFSTRKKLYCWYCIVHKMLNLFNIFQFFHLRASSKLRKSSLKAETKQFCTLRYTLIFFNVVKGLFLPQRTSMPIP